MVTAKSVIMIGSAIVAVLLVSIAITIWVRIPYTECWRNTLSELDVITRPTTWGFDSCIGNEEFNIPLKMTDCVEKVDFTDFTGCMRLCGDIDSDLREGCLEACEDCRYHSGCIVAVPDIPSKSEYWKVWEAWETHKGRSSLVVTYPTNDYSFTEISITSDDVEELCLEFFLREKNYNVVKNEGKSCEVSECV